MWTDHLTPGSAQEVAGWPVPVRHALGASLWASAQLPALRLVALQAGFPLSEPRMNIKTIYLAIRVVKNTLSDTRSKVTGQRPAGDGAWGSLQGSKGKLDGQPPLISVAFTPLQLCG